ncbi:MAG TPA: HAD-IB family phosphatase, partial [Verrucomicrobiae bacterium]|nr:HAD-IB family phosphatase [Verrucomicrobiae bacterium]
EELLAAYDKRQVPFADYASAFTQKLEDGFFGGMKEADVCAIAKEIAERERDRTYVFTRELLRALQKLDYCTIAISGSFYGVVEPFAEAWGFEHAYGTELHTDDDGVYHGTPEQTTVHARNKGDLLRALMQAHELSDAGSVAIGDSMNDASMLELVEHPMLFNPDEKLLRHFSSRSESSWLVVERRVIYQARLGRELAVFPPDVWRLLADALSRFGMKPFAL